MKKILLFGGTGMAGNIIALYLKERGHDLVIFSRKKLDGFNCIIGDVTNTKLVEDSLKNQFDFVINCVGILNEQCDKDTSLAIYVNSYFPHQLSRLCEMNNSKLIHISTDCVFSGEKGNYLENSLRDGLSMYDRSKALGELDNKRDLTFRQSIIGPDTNVNGIGLFNWFMKQEGQISGYSKAIWTGVTTLTLAKAIEYAFTNDIVGIYHLVNNDRISKYSLLGLFNKHFRKNDLNIVEDSRLAMDKSLINSRNDFDFIVPSYEQMVIEMKDWILKHLELYPHYNDNVK